MNHVGEGYWLLLEEEQGGTGQAGEGLDCLFTFILNQRLVMLQRSKDCAHLPVPLPWGGVLCDGSSEAGASVGSGAQDGFILKTSGQGKAG